MKRLLSFLLVVFFSFNSFAVEDVGFSSEEKRSILEVIPNAEEVQKRIEENKLTFEDYIHSESRPRFLRISRDEFDRAMTLDVATISYIKKTKDGKVIEVDLIGAIHIAEPFFYDNLNEKFKDYDALLYELVAEKGTIPQKKQFGNSPIHKFQSSITAILGLEHQLTGVDYTGRNFIHADLSPNELRRLMKKRGESPMVYFLEAIAESLKKKPPVKSTLNPRDNITEEELLLDLVKSSLTEKPSLVLKRYLALQFEDQDTELKAFSGGLGKLIVDDRNKACFKVLDDELKNGKVKVGIFYGAAHLPDMEERLVKRGFAEKDIKWNKAWLLR